MSDFEKCELPGSHEIKSDSVLICSETGRVVAVFYNDYDLDSVLSQLEAATQLITEHNEECERMCPKDCVYKTTYKKTRCPDCSKDWMITPHK